MKQFLNFIKIRDDIGTKNFEFSFGFCPWFMRIMGIWPIDDYGFQKSKFLVTLSAYTFLLYSTSTGIFTAPSRTESYKRSLYLIVAAATTAKLILIKMNKQKLKRILDQIASNWHTSVFESQKSKQVMTTFANRGRMINIFLTVFSQISYLVFVTTFEINFYEKAIVIDGKTVNAIYPKDLLNHQNLIILYIFEAFCSLVHVMCVLSMDCFFMILILHATSKYVIIGNGIEDITLKRIYGPSSKILINKHTNIIRLVQNIEKVFNIILLTDFLKYILHFGILIHLIRMHYLSKNYFRLAEASIFLYSINSFIFLPFLFIQRMIDAAERIGMVTYFTDWNKLDLKEYHYIVRIIQRAQQADVISAGTFFKLTMATYKNIILSSASYASVLFSMK